MPVNITDVSSFTAPIQAPADGDAATGANFDLGIQGLANRTLWLKTQLLLLDPNQTGVRFVRRVANIAALQAIAGTDHADTGVCIVDTIGMYEYSAASSAPAASPMVVTPTDVGGGNGRWLLSMFGALNVANGVPGLDASTRTPIGQARNGIISAQVAKTTVNQSTASTTYADVPGLTLSFTAIAGDLLIVQNNLMLNIGLTGPIASTIANITDGGVPATIAETLRTKTTFDGEEYRSAGTIYTVANTGAITLKQQFKATSNTAYVDAPSTLTGILIRP
jgi:hypothetical protein